eukprot:9570323-Prorocentrum_lima.AAC.1
MLQPSFGKCCGGCPATSGGAGTAGWRWGWGDGGGWVGGWMVGGDGVGEWVFWVDGCRRVGQCGGWGA